MHSKSPQFIEFRRHVNELIANGELVTPEDALIYAIKECQDREISYRIQSAKTTSIVDHRHVDEYCAAKIFFRTESLDASDFNYLRISTSRDDKLKLLETLNPIIGINRNHIESDSRDQIKLLINSLLNTDGDGRSYRSNIGLTQGGYLATTIANVYDDEAEGAKVYKAIMENASSDHEMWNYSCYLDHLQYAITLRLHGDTQELLHWLNVETIASHNGELVYEEPVRQYEVVRKLMEVIDSITTKEVGQLTKSRQAELAPFVERLESRLLAHLNCLSQTLDKGVTPALMMFGNRNSKDGGSKMPYKMTSFFRSLIKLNAHQDLTREICTKTLIKLCNGSVKTMKPSEVTQIIDSVKDSVDWPMAISGMNAKGRALMISRFPDTRYYRDLISRDERAMAVRGDLEL